MTRPRAHLKFTHFQIKLREPVLRREVDLLIITFTQVKHRN